MDDMLLVITPPNRWVKLDKGCVPAHPVYRVGGGRLLRMGQTNPRGGAMALDTRGVAPGMEMRGLCRQIVHECSVRGFGSVVCTGPAPQAFASVLDDALALRGVELCVPEGWGKHTQNARVMVGTALSGGSLICRLEEAMERWGGPRRVALWVERVAEDFFLPAREGRGRALTGPELSELMGRLRPAVFFSDELCARYFTYMTGEGGAHFVLFDDGDTIRKKLQIARQLGIDRAVARYEWVEDLAER